MVEKRTYAQRAETIKRAVKKRRKRVRQLAIEYLADVVRYADISNASMLLKSIIEIQKKNLLRSQLRE